MQTKLIYSYKHTYDLLDKLCKNFTAKFENSSKIISVYR
jgi:hypothetical protein